MNSEPWQSERVSVEKKRLTWLVCFMAILPFLLSPLASIVSFQILLLTYGGIYTGLRIAANRDRRKKSLKPDSSSLQHWPKVSILIPAHNEESVITDTVANVLKIDYPDFETFVINDNSDDGTEAQLRKLTEIYARRFNYLNRTKKSMRGKAAALNDGMAYCHGDIICILDADAKVNSDFLKKLIPYFSEETVGAIQPQKQLSYPTQNILTLCQHYEYLLDAQFQAGRDKVFGGVELRGNGMLVRRSVLAALGGWNEESLSEDLDLCTRMHMAGWALRHIPDVHVQEEAVPHFGSLFRQRLRWTEGSIIRYLENIDNILANKKVAFRAKLDAVQFIFEFIAPVWLLSENIFFAFKWLTGQMPGHFVPFAAPAMLVLSAYFLWSAYQGISKFGNLSSGQAILGAILTYLYLSLIWLPLVFVLLSRLLCQSKRNLVWEKTPRYRGVIS